jgi:hypothetical protein
MPIQSPWRDLISEPLARDHFVQVYRDDRVLVESVALFAGAALGRHEAVILVATARHGAAIEECLRNDGFDVPGLRTWGQLQILDAEEVLSRFMVDGVPDEAKFKAVIADLMASTRGSRRFRAVRVYGEMVNLLWSENLPAATRLEQLWNDQIEEHQFALFCAYCVSGREGTADVDFPTHLQDLHTHLIPHEAHA